MYMQAIQKMRAAQAFAHDVGIRLQEMPEHPLIQPRHSNQKYIGFDREGQLSKCTGPVPGGTILTQGNGLTEYTNPLGNGTLYMYDNNTCNPSNPSCFSGADINPKGNAHIDHPNRSSSSHNINPVRYLLNTTFYAVWSIAYLPCGTWDRKKRKIFITVYWFDPEPEENTGGSLLAKLQAGDYHIKHVSLVIDKIVGGGS